MTIDDEITPEDVASFKSILEKYEQRENVPFNGVMGLMPEWVPIFHKNDFYRIRNNLLNDTYEYDGELISEDRIVNWIDAYAFIAEAPSEEYSRPSIIPLELMVVIGKLYQYRHAVKLGETEGLRFLAGDIAVMGTKSKNGYKTRADQLDKADFQVLAKPLLEKNNNIIDKTLREKALASYVSKWSLNAVRGWLRELRPIGLKQTGRPPKS